MPFYPDVLVSRHALKEGFRMFAGRHLVNLCPSGVVIVDGNNLSFLIL